MTTQDQDRERVCILIVDDHPANLLAVRATLEPLGETLITARSGHQALSEIVRHDFALILLDVRMAVLDGYETARAIRQVERARDTPIIFFTAFDRESHHARLGYSLGAVDYLYKPIDPDLLRDKVRSFVSLHRERRARHRAEHALHLKDMILGVIGHDLRSPITAIRASAELLLRHEKTPERVAAIQRIGNSAQRMDRMVRSLVDYARSWFGGGMPLVLAPERMETIVTRLVDEVRAAHPKRDISVHVDGDTSGTWDADRVAQALGNLILNAIEHSQSAVELQVRGEAEDVTVSVQNAGPFPPELRGSLFQPFRKGERGSRGLGLGLFIVNEVLRAHGGRIALGDDATHTRFVTHWPRQPRPQNTAAQLPPRTPVEN